MISQHGYLVLADISGYTAYLAGVELDHAYDILSDLLETVVKKLRPTLTLVKLEGEAVFAYVPESNGAIEPGLHHTAQGGPRFIIKVRPFRHLVGIVGTCPPMKGVLGRRMAQALGLIRGQIQKSDDLSVPEREFGAHMPTIQSDRAIQHIAGDEGAAQPITIHNIVSKADLGLRPHIAFMGGP